LIAEISRVRGSVLSFSDDSDALDLPEAIGPVVTLSEKLTIPVKEHPEVIYHQCRQRETTYMSSWERYGGNDPKLKK